jgi:hypothetical protein
MDYRNALNKRLALVLWAEDEDGEDDVVVFSGVLIQTGENYYFQHEGDGLNPEIRPEWLSRIKRVPEELKETLMSCDYQLSLSVGNAKDMDEPFEDFGLKWPE